MKYNTQDIEQVVNKQLKTIDYFAQHEIANIEGTDLTRAAIALATNNAYLGQILAEEEYQAGMINVLKESAKIDEYARLRGEIDENTGKLRSQKDCEMLADKHIIETEKEEIENRRMLLKIKNLRSDCRDLLTAIQTRLSVLKQERMDSFLPNAQ